MLAAVVLGAIFSCSIHMVKRRAQGAAAAGEKVIEITSMGDAGSVAFLVISVKSELATPYE